MTSDKIVIGLFGFGVVGEGIYRILTESASSWATIKRICIKHPEKPRTAMMGLFTDNPDDLLDDSEINVIVELIDDANAAFEIAMRAFENGKAVVSANKKAIAENLEFYLAAQKRSSRPLLYEAAVAGSIPIIRNLEEYYDNDWLRSVVGIINGSTNYILSRVEDGESPSVALAQAQEGGYAESNPILDTEGWDAVNKLAILLYHTYGIQVHPSSLPRCGINRLHAHDAAFARERGLRIRLIARAERQLDDSVRACVWPHFVSETSPLFQVRGAMNGILVGSTFADQQFLYGKGAGRFPTAGAVLSDISALRYDYRYEYKKSRSPASLSSRGSVRVWIRASNLSSLDSLPFNAVSERYERSDFAYVIGEIDYLHLLPGGILDSEQFSVIIWPSEEGMQQSLR